MTKVLIEWSENKNNDWKVCTIKEGNQTITDVSVNRTNKKGEVFPNFDGIAPGFEVECEIWKSQTGKTYMFAPKTQTAPRAGGAGIKAAMVEKAKAIEHSQDRKDNAIQLSSTFRDATLLTQVTISAQQGDFDREDIKKVWLEWRSWLLEQFGDASDITETKKPF